MYHLEAVMMDGSYTGSCRKLLYYYYYYYYYHEYSGDYYKVDSGLDKVILIFTYLYVLAKNCYR